MIKKGVADNSKTKAERKRKAKSKTRTEAYDDLRARLKALDDGEGGSSPESVK